jgi:hypothetical protein
MNIRLFHLPIRNKPLSIPLEYFIMKKFGDAVIRIKQVLPPKTFSRNAWIPMQVLVRQKVLDIDPIAKIDHSLIPEIQLIRNRPLWGYPKAVMLRALLMLWHLTIPPFGR